MVCSLAICELKFLDNKPIYESGKGGLINGFEDDLASLGLDTVKGFEGLAEVFGSEAKHFFHDCKWCFVRSDFDRDQTLSA